jgi:hypothetical protein
MPIQTSEQHPADVMIEVRRPIAVFDCRNEAPTPNTNAEQVDFGKPHPSAPAPK